MARLIHSTYLHRLTTDVGRHCTRSRVAGESDELEEVRYSSSVIAILVCDSAIRCHTFSTGIPEGPPYLILFTLKRHIM